MIPGKKGRMIFTLCGAYCGSEHSTLICSKISPACFDSLKLVKRSCWRFSDSRHSHPSEASHYCRKQARTLSLRSADRSNTFIRAQLMCAQVRRREVARRPWQTLVLTLGMKPDTQTHKRRRESGQHSIRTRVRTWEKEAKNTTWQPLIDSTSCTKIFGNPSGNFFHEIVPRDTLRVCLTT